MKKNILVGMLALAFGSFNTFAQTATPAVQAAPAAAQNGMHKGQQMADAATRAQHEADRLTKSLGLDATTSKKVYDAALAHSQGVDKINAGTAAGGKEAAFKANKATFVSALQGILSADQFAKFQQTTAKHHKGDSEKGDQPKQK